MDGINAGRKTIPLARFDKKRTAQGLETLRSYRTEWDEKTRAFKKTPEHNWASHGSGTRGDICLCLGARRCASRRRRRCRSASPCRTSPWINSWSSRTAGRGEKTGSRPSRASRARTISAARASRRVARLAGSGAG